jgi:ABC-type multidrug transport system ATPase subunit
VPVIQTEQLTKRYGSERGLDGVSMAVIEGEVFGLPGPNGAGKTTMIRTLLDLLHPTAGQALVFGLDSTETAGRSGPAWETCPATSHMSPASLGATCSRCSRHLGG